MFRRIDSILALFDPNRAGPRFAGFLFGIALPLVCADVVFAVYHGGLSDTRATAAPVYVIE